MQQNRRRPHELTGGCRPAPCRGSRSSIARLARGVGALCLLTLAMGARGEIAFGARTQIWPFLFADQAGGSPGQTTDQRVKYEVATGNLDRYRELGATWNIVDVWQDVDGPDGFRRLDRVFNEHERRGIEVALRLLERQKIYDEIRSGGEAAANALREYRQWIQQIARRYGTRVRYYMISNETDHDIGYNSPAYRAFRRISVDEYRELLRTAYESIHAVDARLKVADHGVSSYSLALAVMADLATAGRPGDALAFWRSMAYEVPDDGERTLPRLLGRLANAESRRRIEFARRSTAELTTYRDVYQLHHYYGPVPLPAVLEWIRGQLARTDASQPIVAAEVGYLIPAKKGTSWDGRPVSIADMSRYSAVSHGTSIAQTIATLAGHGINDILYWQIRFHTAHHGPAASLFPAAQSRDDFRWIYPAEVFRFVAREMTGASPMAPTPGLREGDLVEYRFQRNDDFSLLWTTDGKAITIPPALRTRIDRMVDAAGRPVGPASANGDIGTAPVFVYWQSQTAGK